MPGRDLPSPYPMEQIAVSPLFSTTASSSLALSEPPGTPPQPAKEPSNGESPPGGTQALKSLATSPKPPAAPAPNPSGQGSSEAAASMLLMLESRGREGSSPESDSGGGSPLQDVVNREASLGNTASDNVSAANDSAANDSVAAHTSASSDSPPPPLIYNEAPQQAVPTRVTPPGSMPPAMMLGGSTAMAGPMSRKSPAVMPPKSHGGHTCPYCSKVFVSQSKVKRHCLVHTKDKPFHCNTCFTRFTQKSALKAHVQKKHGQEFDEVTFKRSADSQSLEWQRRDMVQTGGALHNGALHNGALYGNGGMPYMQYAPQGLGPSMMYYQMVPMMPMPMQNTAGTRSQV
eukprot:m.98403 g.98403  ORF g.98403 m.98403 type:complete len:345 (+) comp20558_c0_seq5:269-1303(+)